MATILGDVIATLITAPILAFIIVYYMGFLVTKKRKQSFRTAIDVTALFLMVSVDQLFIAIWKTPFHWILILLIMAGFVAISFMIKVSDKDITFFQFLRMNCRLQFLIMTFMYLSLFVYGITIKIFSV